MEATIDDYKSKLLSLLDELPEPQIREVYHFTAFHKKHFTEESNASGVPSVRADHLASLIGLTKIGGDALKDTEELYYE
ncbi:MAG: hypothetical protein ACE5I1_22390 [bacterium]